jgi:hypothetical protein
MLYPVWLILAAIFFSFGYVHWSQAKRDLRPFKLRERSGEAAQSDEMLQGFVSEFNSYLEAINAQNRAANRAAATGYFVSGLVALISMFMTLG